MSARELKNLTTNEQIEILNRGNFRECEGAQTRVEREVDICERCGKCKIYSALYGTGDTTEQPTETESLLNIYEQIKESGSEVEQSLAEEFSHLEVNSENKYCTNTFERSISLDKGIPRIEDRSRSYLQK